MNWLAAQRNALNLQWMLHVGDVQNWDTSDHIQFVKMSDWFATFERSGIPWVSAVGNHDTAAVCSGGSACPGQSTNLALRVTTTWNVYYPATRFTPDGVFEANKSDNLFRTFDAGGLHWLVLDLELWPRTEVITWATNVVAGHPHHNVILLTHAFLEGDGSLSTRQGGYGSNSPLAVWNALRRYPNVVMAFSGHVGTSASNVLTASDGHKMAALLGCFHDAYMNPVRLVTVDPDAGTIRTVVKASFDKSRPAGAQDIDYTYDGTAQTFTGMTWVE